MKCKYCEKEGVQRFGMSEGYWLCEEHTTEELDRIVNLEDEE